MKALLLIPLAGLLAWAGWAFRSSASTDRSAVVSHPLPAPAAVTADTAQIFQRAFWRRAATDDKILHAERREWKDGAEVSHWQWFLAVEPGAALKDWLVRNPLRLQPVTQRVSFQIYAAAPEWFPRGTAPEEYEIHQAVGGRMTLLFSRNQNLLYATDAGQGFQKSDTVGSCRPLCFC